MPRTRVLLVLFAAFILGAVLSSAQQQQPGSYNQDAYGDPKPNGWIAPVPNGRAEDFSGSPTANANYQPPTWTSPGALYSPPPFYPCGHLATDKLDKPGRKILSAGVKDLKKHRYAAAESKFQQLASTHPDFADSWFLLGAALRGQDRTEEAVSAYQRSLKLETTILANVGLMEIANQRQNWQSSLRHAKEAINAGGDTCRYVQLYRAFAEFHLGDLSAAETADHAAINLRWTPQIPVGAEPYLLLSDISRKRGDVAGAEQYLRAAKGSTKEQREVIRAKMDALKQLENKPGQQSQPDNSGPR